MDKANSTALSGIPAVSYIRMSSGKQEASPDQQRAEVKKLAERHGCRIVREYFDEAISGDATDKRKGFLAMHRAACSSRDFDVILCWDQDRFGRFDSIEAGYWIKPLRDAGVKLITVSQGPIDWSDFAGRMIYSIQQEGKNAYLRDLSRNVCRGMRAAAERGELPVACYGYRVVEGRLVPDPGTAPIVRRIFSEYLKSGASLRSVCALLNSEHIPTPWGGLWQTTCLRVVLTRRKYTGTYTWGESQRGTYHASGPEGVVPRVKGEPIRYVAPLMIPNSHEALVSIEDFEAAQRKLRERKGRTAPFRGVGEYRLSGLLRCAHCRGVMIGHQGKRRGEQVRWYDCSSYHIGGRAKCSRHRILEAPLVDAILRKLQSDWLAPENLEVLRQTIRQQLEAERATPTQDAEALRARRAKLDKQIENAADRILEAPAAITTILYARLEKLQDQRRQLQTELEAMKRSVAGLGGSVAAEAEEAVAALWRLRDAIAEADPGDLRALLKQAVARVDLYFTHRDTGTYRKSDFQRGIAHLRVDPRISSLVQPGHAIC